MTTDQAMYHFLSGYTAKVAGTEQGVVEPQATFSTCFGGPFMPLAPSVYAKLLGKKVAAHDVKVWLVNTGWTGGPYGTGTGWRSVPPRRCSGPRSPGSWTASRCGWIRSSDCACRELPGRAVRGPGPEVDVEGSRGV